MKQSESIKEIATALSSFQGEITSVSKDSVNPFFKMKYASLSAVWDTIKKPLTDNGLSVTQVALPITEDGRIILETMLMHSSGEWISGSLPIKPVKDDPQGLGSAITYARRYAISGLLGIVADEDDDGETHRTTQSPTKQQPKPSTATTEPEKAVQEELQKAGVESEVESVEKIPQTAVEFYNWLLTLPKGKTQNKTWFLKVTGTKEEELATPDGVRHAYDWMQEHLKGNYEKT